MIEKNEEGADGSRASFLAIASFFQKEKLDPIQSYNLLLVSIGDLALRLR